MKALFLALAHANRWSNELLYAELAKLSPGQWTQPSAVDFGSLQGIANHQTHHRGQLHALLGIHGLKAPNIDLIYSPAAQTDWGA